VKKKFSLFLVLLLAVSTILAACSSGEKTQGDDKAGGDKEKENAPQVLNIIDTAEIPTMDTVMGTDQVAFQVMNEVFEGLYRLGPENEPVPGVAKEHSVSEDGLVWTFKLRDNAKWSNGKPVTAHDFVFAWRRAIDSKTGSEYGPYMMNDVIKNASQISAGKMPVDQLGVKAVDDYTLEVTLERPVPYFLSLMTFATFLPQNEEFVTSQGDKYALEAENLIYNGPFKMTEWKHEEGWVLEKNPDYWDVENVRLEKINVKVVKDTATAVNLYETGQIDRVGLAAEYVDKYKNSPEFKTFLEPTIFYFKFNQTKNKALANVNIRKAISMAIDKQGLVDVILNNGSVVANYAVPKDFVKHPETGEDFRDKNGDMNVYNVEEAKKYWEQGLKELGVSELTVEILGGDTELSKKMDEYFKNQLEKNLPGLKITLKEVPFETRLDLDTKMDYEIQVAGWGPDYLDAMTFADLWVTDGGHNHMGYSNPKYDKLIQDAKTTLADKPAERFEAMQEAERILMEDAAIAPIYQRGAAQLWKPYVKGVVVHPFGPDYSYKWAYIEK